MTARTMFETLTLDQLRLFLCAAEEGSFSAAGRRLSRAQSAVSQGISNLEGTLGVELFDRSGRTPKLTDSGHALLGDVDAVFAQVNQVRTRAASIADGLEAELSIAVDVIFPADLLVQICRVFQAQFPSVPLRVHTEVLGTVAALVLDGSCHLGIVVPTALDETKLVHRFLTHVAMVPVVAPSHRLARVEAPIPTSVLRDQVQIIIGERSDASDRSRGVLSRRTWRVADGATKFALIRAGLGWGTLPCEMVGKHLTEAELVQLSLEEWGPQPRHEPLSSVIRADSPPGPAGHWLLEQLEVLCKTCNQ